MRLSTMVPALGRPLTPFFFIHSSKTLFSAPWRNSAPISTARQQKKGSNGHPGAHTVPKALKMCCVNRDIRTHPPDQAHTDSSGSL